METHIKNAIRTRYWDGESLMALADEHHLALKSVEQMAAIEGWGIARAMLDDLRAQMATPMQG
ncbi:hypothetical protein H6F75_26855 [Nodosilinea sp. FACHB-131]|uniref:hypothetical protein n=1 Tax=Cyanophyceae TaxID=3028117 RepID=UPI0016826D18|nr:hypothetical protein [Nodosilinea sp. FACHB-131]MBD1877109.1 hypothetical protein [Nodosilinea sp. FACHB-131]